MKPLALWTALALTVTAACTTETHAYRAVRFGDLIGAVQDPAGVHAFKMDRSAQIRGGFNASNCAECHALPALGGTQKLQADFAIKQSVNGRAVTFPRYEVGNGGARFRYPRGRFYLRKPPPLYGIGLLDAVQGAEVAAIALEEARASPQHRGRPARLPNDEIGRFGWKAQIPTLSDFVATAFIGELGVHSAKDVPAVTAFVRKLAAPPPGASGDVSRGKALFARIGCADCHRPSLRIGTGTIDPYTDLLLHDMGAQNAELADGVATASEFRTPPLWGVAMTGPYLHNGRAHSLSEAIVMHGGQAADSASAFRALSHRDRNALIQFLRSL